MDDRDRLQNAIEGLPLAEREMALAKEGVARLPIAEATKLLDDIARLRRLVAAARNRVQQ